MTTRRAALDFTTAAFTALGVAPVDAQTTSAALITAEVWGLGSHGLLRVPQYLRRLAAGGISAAGQGRVTVDLGALLVLDGEAGLGQVHLHAAAHHGVERARRHGVSAVAVANSHHGGALAVTAWPALRAGCAVIVLSNGPAVMPAPGGSRAMLSTSPVCIAVPLPGGEAGEPQPLIVDLATSAVARGTIAEFAARGEDLPAGWAMDASGNPTTDAQVALRGMLAALGGTKGAALALGIEALTGGLIGPHLSAEVPDLFDPAMDTRAQGLAHLVMTLDAAALGAGAGVAGGVGAGQGAGAAEADARLRRLAAHVDASGGRLPGAAKADPDTIDLSAELPIPEPVRRSLTDWGARLGIGELP